MYPEGNQRMVISEVKKDLYQVRRNDFTTAKCLLVNLLFFHL